jgi:hypothetical protein
VLRIQHAEAFASNDVKIPIMLLRLIVSDTQNEEDQKPQIKVDMQEVASGWAS